MWTGSISCIPTFHCSVCPPPEPEPMQVDTYCLSHVQCQDRQSTVSILWNCVPDILLSSLSTMPSSEYSSSSTYDRSINSIMVTTAEHSVSARTPIWLWFCRELHLPKPSAKTSTQEKILCSTLPHSYIEEALKQKFICPSTSPAASSFFFVCKKDGGLRPCIDLPCVELSDHQIPLPTSSTPCKSPCNTTKLDKDEKPPTDHKAFTACY